MSAQIGRAVVLFTAACAVTLASERSARADDDDQGGTRGFFASPQGGGGWASVVLDQQFRDIQRLSLPPGRYVANATAALASGSPDFQAVGCFFRVGEVFQGDTVQGLIGGGVNNFVTLPITAGFTLRTTQDLAVACAAERPDLVVSQPSPITAIRVDRLTVQGGFQP